MYRKSLQFSFVATLICVGHCIAGESQTSIQQIRSSPSIGKKVTFEATVTYCHLFWQFIFVAENDYSIFVHDVNGSFAPGDRVRVSGTVSAGDLNPVIAANSVIVIGHASLPTPIQVDASTLEAGEHDCSYVTLEGDIIQIVVGDPQSEFLCRNREREFFISLADPSLTLEDAYSMIGRRVTATGSLGLELENPSFEILGENDARSVRGSKLFAASLNELKFIDSAAERRRQLPTATRLNALDQPTVSTNEFLTHGQISYVDDQSFILFDSYGAVKARIPCTYHLDTGAVIRVIGTRAIRKGEVTLEANCLQILNHPRLRRIKATESPSEAIASFRPYHRKSIVGRPVSQTVRNGALLLELADVDSSVEVKLLPDAGEKPEKLNLDLVKTLRIAGVAIPKKGSKDFQLVARLSGLGGKGDIDGIEIIEQRISPARTLGWGIATLTSIVGLCLLWVKTLRLTVAEKTRQAKTVYAQLLSSYESIGAGILAVDGQGKVLATNKEMQRLLGTDIRVGQPASVLPWRIGPLAKDAQLFSNLWARCLHNPELVEACDLELNRENGNKNLEVRTAPINSEAGPIGRLWIFRDQTEKRVLQDELIRSNKLEAVGQMASGLAHDFNNVLMAIAANLSIARIDDQKKVAEVARELLVAEDAAFRGGDIVRRLLTFARNDDFQPSLVCVNSIVRRLDELVSPTFDASYDFTHDLDPAEPKILAESTAIEQVLLNLYVNARDAMPDGGKITTVTRCVHNSATGLNMVAISVLDCGPAIEEDVLPRIFDPFFTTKKADGGSGLGLSVSYRIIQQHGGTISCNARDGGGCEFQVLLPVCFNPNTQLHPDPRRIEQLAHGEGTILVVDDEDVVRSVSQTMLRRHGYETLSASNGEEAIEVAQQEAGRLAAILLDLTMPGKSGREVAKELKRLWPDLPIILCSGYLLGSDPALTFGADFPVDAAIEKPYSMRKLLETVADVLEKSRARTASN